MQRFAGLFVHHEGAGLKFRTLPRLAFRAPPRLRDILVHSTLCNDAHLEGEEFESPHCPGTKCKIRGRATCKSSNIIYMVSCAQCGEIGVGQTGTSLDKRMPAYRSNILHRGGDAELNLNRIEQHFRQADHQNGMPPIGTERGFFGELTGWTHFRVRVIDVVRELPPGHPQARYIREFLEAERQDRLRVSIRNRRARNRLSFGGGDRAWG